MKEQTFVITNETGLHARPATKLVQSVSNFESEVNLEYKGKSVNLKSIMGVMSLGIPQGSEIKVVAEGSDEVEAIAAVEEVISSEELGSKK